MNSANDDYGELYGRSFGKSGAEFVIGKRIGMGGYGEVYRATQMEIERVVALKVLRRSETGRYPEKLRQRFQREAKIIGSLRDPHTVKLLDYGTDQETKLLYMAFEFVDGVTIGDVISSERGIGPGRVVDILRQALLGLEEAHSVGVVHRDIKPGNIMLYEYMNRRDQVKVLDFGIGKLLVESEDDVRLTAVGGLVGTPKYMSPEQIRGDQVGPQADIFSLGLVAWEMLTGYSLLPTDSIVVTGRLLSDEKFVLPNHACAEAPGVRQVVEKMLEKDCKVRYGKASDVIRDLGHLRPLSDSEVKTVTMTTSPRLPSITEKPPSTPMQVELVGPLHISQKSSALPWALLGLVIIAGLTAAAFLWSQSKAEVLKPEPLQVVEIPKTAPTLPDETQKQADLIEPEALNKVPPESLSSGGAKATVRAIAAPKVLEPRVEPSPVAVEAPPKVEEEAKVEEVPVETEIKELAKSKPKPAVKTKAVTEPEPKPTEEVAPPKKVIMWGME